MVSFLIESQLVRVPAYGALVLMGVVLAWLLARFLAKRAGAERGLEAADVDLLLPVVAGAGIAGAHVFGWWTGLVLGAASPVGTVLFGSLLLATGAGIGYAMMRGISLGELGDVVAAPIAVGVACGRIGCFLAGCCFGSETGWGVAFPRHSFAWEHQLHTGRIDESAMCALAVHPVQLYEAGIMLVLGIVLLAAFSRRKVAGELFLWLGLGYGALRFGLEFLRADNPAVWRGLTFSQIVSVVVLAAAGGTFGLRRLWADRWGLRVAEG